VGGLKAMTVAMHQLPVAAMLCAVTLVASAVASPPAAFGAAKGPAHPGFSVAPLGKPSLRFAAQPGDTIIGRVRVQNLGARSRTVQLSASDLLTADSGGPSFPATPPEGIGRWLKLGRDNVRLPAHGGVTISFRAIVPADATAGEHYAGIVALDIAEAAAARAPSMARGVSVRHLTRLALPVRLTVPGALVARLALTEIRFGVDASGSSLRVGLRNDGNRIIRATDIDLRVGKDGRRLLSIHDEIRDFIPTAAISYPTAWRGQLRRGVYRVTGVVRPDGGAPIHVDQQVSFTPKLADQFKRQTGMTAAPGDGQPMWIWTALAAALALATAATLAHVRLRRRLRAAEPRLPRRIR
jgi:hypothetical protein